MNSLYVNRLLHFLFSALVLLAVVAVPASAEVLKIVVDDTIHPVTDE